MATSQTCSLTAIISLLLLSTLSTSISFPISSLITNIENTLNQVEKVNSIISNYDKPIDDFLITNAIIDCLDLLNTSSQELHWTLNTMYKIQPLLNVTNYGDTDGDCDGNCIEGDIANLNAWLSAVLSNQETCLEGFKKTNGVIKSQFEMNVHEVMVLVDNLLGMTHKIPVRRVHPGGRRKTPEMDFPTWIPARERRLLRSRVDEIDVDVIVAANGSGDFRTVSDAVRAAPENERTRISMRNNSEIGPIDDLRRYVIYVKAGVYDEIVNISPEKANLILIGDGMNKTIITGDRSHGNGYTTYGSATLAVKGKGFIARDISFVNTAGPRANQAVAVLSDSDMSVYYQCGIHGYQDTLFVHSLRQFYRECNISGTVDFIFGQGSAVFQNCIILVRKPLPGQECTITAQGRTHLNQNTGFSIQNSKVLADSGFNNSKHSSYLGRPWKPYAATVFMETYLGDLINPKGWLEWEGSHDGLDTLFYGEYMNNGPGSDLSGRANWPGYHQLHDKSQAQKFTVEALIDGNKWLTSTGVQYTIGV
ncbi:pectinesterase/pectinesterase inhibitor PPE8B-like [Tasmannia lanceolata]|uniref:pectinesterase/pectinesterase inhibitor PPE8B-like n=1 Tax=Tasmannia lanceolata TaxID=3420 RepID=UPI0040632076